MCLTLANLHWSFEVKTTTFVLFFRRQSWNSSHLYPKKKTSKMTHHVLSTGVPFHWNRRPIPGGKKQWREAADIWFIHDSWKNHSRTWRELIHRRIVYSHARFIDFLLYPFVICESLRSLIQQSASFHSTWDNASWQPVVSKLCMRPSQLRHRGV